MNIPLPTIERLTTLYRLVKTWDREHKTTTSSSELSRLMGISAHTIRKDISHLGEVGNGGAGYDTRALISLIESGLGLGGITKVCIIGLGRLGSSILHYPFFLDEGYEISAGFDINTNKIELLQTSVPLYQIRDLQTVIKSKEITLAIITTPAEQAENVAKQAFDAGVAGIVNFAPVFIHIDGCIVKNLSISGELRIINATRHTNSTRKGVV